MLHTIIVLIASYRAMIVRHTLLHKTLLLITSQTPPIYMKHTATLQARNSVTWLVDLRRISKMWNIKKCSKMLPLENGRFLAGQ